MPRANVVCFCPSGGGGDGEMRGPCRCCCRPALTVVMVERMLTLLLSFITGRRGGGGGERGRWRGRCCGHSVVVVVAEAHSQFDSEVFARNKITSAAFA